MNALLRMKTDAHALLDINQAVLSNNNGMRHSYNVEIGSLSLVDFLFEAEKNNSALSLPPAENTITTKYPQHNNKEGEV